MPIRLLGLNIAYEAFTASGSSLSGFAGTKQLLPFTGVMDRAVCPADVQRTSLRKPSCLRAQSSTAEISLGSVSWTRQHLHHVDEQGFSCP